MKHKSRHNIPALTALILLCLVVISVAINAGFYAKYTTGTDNSAVTRIGTFEVTGDGFTDSINMSVTMKPGESASQSLDIFNTSEVAVKCYLTIRNRTCNLPLKLQFGDEAAASLDDAQPVTREIVLEPHSGTESFDFSFLWAQADNDISYSGQLDVVSIDLAAVQMD